MLVAATCCKCYGIYEHDFNWFHPLSKYEYAENIIIDLPLTGSLYHFCVVFQDVVALYLIVYVY